MLNLENGSPNPTILEWGVEIILFLLALLLSWRRFYARIKERNAHPWLALNDPSFKSQAWKEALSKENITTRFRDEARRNKSMASFVTSISAVLVLLITFVILYLWHADGGTLDEGYWITLGLSLLALGIPMDAYRKRDRSG